MMSPDILTLSLVTILCGAASAQPPLDNRWVEFAKDNSHLGAGLVPSAISSPTDETDLAWADLDHNGFIDLVVVRKQPFTQPGWRPNLLLMNEAGVLVDRSASHASLSDVPGDQGFLTPTHDRDVVIADVDNDGWDDVITATSLADGETKAIGHPRVYRNLGVSLGGWLGLRYEESRIPQLFQYTNGNPQNPRAGGRGYHRVEGRGRDDDLGPQGTYDVAVFDIDNDGDLDLISSRSAGTEVWENQAVVSCAPDLGSQGPGSLTLTLCGDGLQSGGSNTLSVTGGPSSVPLLVFVSLPGGIDIPVAGGAMVSITNLLPGFPVVLSTDAAGTLSLPVSGGGGPVSVVVQAAAPDATQPLGAAISNAILLSLLP